MLLLKKEIWSGDTLKKNAHKGRDKAADVYNQRKDSIMFFFLLKTIIQYPASFVFF